MTLAAISPLITAPPATDGWGPLALVDALDSRLGRASSRARLALETDGPGSVGAAHAWLARAWIHLERAEFDECARCLDVAENTSRDRGPWLETLLVLADARLLVHTGQPATAVGRLASAATGVDDAGDSDWAAGVLSAGRAAALLAAGEPRRALTAITPLPPGALVEASVVAAAIRHAIRDDRGAWAVLAGVVDALEAAPLSLRIRAWVLEARIATDRGDHARSRLLVDRALVSATPEQLRAPLREDWGWLRTFLDREPQLRHRHQALAQSLESLHVPDRHRSDVGHAASLTERECEVLELLAQMYSTDEIARTLYVSTNTIKTHVKGIFVKLGVNRRVDAVRRGRALGLC